MFRNKWTKILIILYVLSFLSGCFSERADKVSGCIIFYGDNMISDLEVQVYSDANKTEIMNFSSFSEEMKIFSDHLLEAEAHNRKFEAVNCNNENYLSGSRGTFSFFCKSNRFSDAEQLVKDFVFSIALYDENGKQIRVVRKKLPVFILVE